MTRGTMKDDGLSDEEAREMKARARRTEDYQDSIAESSGRDRGKRLRFLSEDQTPKGRDARQQERRQQQDRLQTFTLTMQQRVQQLQTRLDQLDRASLEALREADRRAEQAQKRLEEIQNAATADDQGRRVYRTEDGRTAYYHNGDELTREAQQRVNWKPDGPTWEAHRHAIVETEQAVQQRDEVLVFREHLKDHSKRLNGDPSPDDIAAIERDLDNVPTAVAARLSAAQQSRTSAAREHMSDKSFASAPDVTESFNQAGSGEPVTQQARNDRAPPQPKEAPRRP